MSLVPIETNGEVIIPPESIRNIIDKTAQFISAKGGEFERRMLLEPNARERFEFLFANSPYRAYYDAKLVEYQTGQVKISQPTIPEAIIEMRKKEQERKDKREKLLMLVGHVKEDSAEAPTNEDVSPPDPDEFIVRHPYIAPVDGDIIKLTAQFVARNGQSFLSGLQQREKTNPQFEFLKSSHAAHAYFEALVGSYQKCLQSDERLCARLRSLQSQEVVNRMRKRYRWNDQENRNRKAQEEAEAEERAAIAAIDWDGFVVVETIIFTEGDHKLTLPLPATLESVQGKANEAPPPVLSTPPEPMCPTKVETRVETKPLTLTLDGESQKVVLKPGHVRRGKRGPTKLMQKCPLTGQLIPVEQMTNHLKVLLLDPQWNVQRDLLLQKAQADSALAQESDVEAHIAQFVLKRPDLFGTVDDEVQEHTLDVPEKKYNDEEQQPSKKARN